MENKKVAKKKFKRISEDEKRRFNFQNSDGERITSSTPQALVYRAVNRPRVEDLFQKSHNEFLRNPEEGWKINKEARELWRQIIRESNKL